MIDWLFGVCISLSNGYGSAIRRLHQFVFRCPNIRKLVGIINVVVVAVVVVVVGVDVVIDVELL